MSVKLKTKGFEVEVSGCSAIVATDIIRDLYKLCGSPKASGAFHHIEGEDVLPIKVTLPPISQDDKNRFESLLPEETSETPSSESGDVKPDVPEAPSEKVSLDTAAQACDEGHAADAFAFAAHAPRLPDGQSKTVAALVSRGATPVNPAFYKRSIKAARPEKKESPAPKPARGPAPGHSQKMTFDAAQREVCEDSPHGFDFIKVDVSLPTVQKKMLDMLRAYAAPNGDSPPVVSQSIPWITQKAKVAESSGHYAVKQLEKKGLVKTHGRGGGVWIL